MTSFRFLFSSFLLFSLFLFADTNYVVINFDDGYYAVYKYAYPILKQEKIPFTIGLITKTLSWSRRNFSPYSYLTIPEIKEMLASGCEIASHSRTHRHLTKLDSAALWEEVFYSKKELESIFQKEIKIFIYPYGRYDQDVLRSLLYSGYLLGRSVGWGEVNFFSPYRLPAREVRKGTEIEEILRYLKRHRFAILLFHRIVPEARYFTDYSVKDFQTLISILKAQPNVKFLTLDDLSRKWWQKELEEILLVADKKKERQLFQEMKVPNDLLATYCK
ncbi:MAG: polysaccharide deacetylase family protein [candidate division WOR-3 bacterium]